MPNRETPQKGKSGTLGRSIPRELIQDNSGGVGKYDEPRNPAEPSLALLVDRSLLLGLIRDNSGEVQRYAGSGNHVLPRVWHSGSNPAVWVFKR